MMYINLAQAGFSIDASSFSIHFATKITSALSDLTEYANKTYHGNGEGIRNSLDALSISTRG